MADLFRSIHGLSIASDDLSTETHIIMGANPPGGDGGEQDEAPIGSLYLRTDAATEGLQLFWKYADTNNVSDWKTAADKDYVDAIAAGLSWRESTLVRDNTSYVDSTEFPTTGTIDGIALVDGNRVLFSNVGAAGESNVWIWDATGSIWVADVNDASDGDALLIKEGTSADEQYIYDGTNWIIFGSATSQAELGFLRAYIGKDFVGNEMPTYTSTNAFAQNVNLETAIGELDGAVGDGLFDNTSGNYSLDDDLGFANGTLTITEALSQLNDGVGDLTFTSSGTNITSGDDVATSLDNLNEALILAQENSSSSVGTTAAGAITAVDTILVSEASEVKWMLQIRETGTPANRRSMEVHALTDGTNIDFTQYAVLTIGSSIPGVSVLVDIQGANVVLSVTATNGLDYVVKRISYSSF